MANISDYMSRLNNEGIQTDADSFGLLGYKWGASTAAGTSGGTVTYAFAPAYISTPSGRTYTRPVSSSYANEIHDAFDTWETVADINFQFVSSYTQADIIVGFGYIDGSRGTLGVTGNSTYGGSLNRSYILFDTAEYWNLGDDTPSSYQADFSAVALHEVGHAIGIDHSTSGTLMAPYQNTGSLSLTSDDISAARAIYGTGSGTGGGTDTSPATGNNTIATAETINLTNNSAVLIGSVGYGGDSDDYFVFSPTSSGTMTISLSGLSADIDLRLLSSSGTQLRSSIASGSSNETISYFVSSGSTYYVRVDPYYSAASNYVLSFSMGNTSTPTNNNTRSTADLLVFDSSGQATINGTVGYGSDSADYFTFTATASGTLDVTLTGLTADIDLRLLSSSGSTLRSSIRSGSNDESVSYEVVEGSTYYIYVDPYYSAASSYSLSVSLENNTPSANDDVTQSEAQGIARLYNASFGRRPDADGLNYWIDAYDDGMSLDNIADNFLSSSEFISRFGTASTISNTTYINLLYQNVLGRNGDAGGINYWTGVLQQSNDRAQLLIDFAQSAENVANTGYLSGLSQTDGVWTF